MKKIALVLSLFLSFGLFAQNEVSTYFKNGNKKITIIKILMSENIKGYSS